MSSKDSTTDKKQKEFEERVLQVSRVSKVTKGGKKLSFRALVVVGDQRSRVGIGLGKAAEVSEAVRKAVQQARKELITVPIINETIPHRVDFAWKSVRLFLGPASPGTGVIAGGGVRSVLELAGIKNVLSKLTQSTNILNSVYATIAALQSLQTAEQTSQLRDKTIIHPAAVAHEESERLRQQKEEEARIAQQKEEQERKKRKEKRGGQGQGGKKNSSPKGGAKGKPAESSTDAKKTDKSDNHKASNSKSSREKSPKAPNSEKVATAEDKKETT